MSEVKDLSGKMKEEEVFEQKLSEDEMKAFELLSSLCL